MILYEQGQTALSEMLREYDAKPAFLVSEGFPAGALPYPLLPPLTQAAEKELFAELHPDQEKLPPERQREKYFDFKADIKKLRRVSWIDAGELADNKGPVTAKRLVRHLLTTTTGKADPRTLTAHNTINRLSGTVEKSGGGFYHTTELSYRGRAFDIYLKTSLPWDDGQIRYLFTRLGKWGYGGDRSVGKGQFEVEDASLCNLPEKANSVMSLSRFVPDPSLGKGYYSIETKYGKLGGSYAQGGGAFPKTPLVMLVAGSVFSVQDIKPYYGISLGTVHPDPALANVRQQTYLFPYFINLGEA
ncbi:MAG: hypothetical protein QM278_11580 [Pseudomonadota bacterium]|nr:hypothetical protein [Pseudomonadota bacterium]